MVQGLGRLKRKLNKTIPDRVRNAARDALEENAKRLVEEMKRLAPEYLGDLIDSIGWTWGDAPAGTMVIGTVAGNDYDTMRITVYAGGGDAFHAFFQEFGTVNMAPNPFFFPSYRKLRRGMKSRVTRSINKAIKTL